MPKYFKLSIKESDFSPEHMKNPNNGEEILSYEELVYYGKNMFAKSKHSLDSKIHDYVLPKDNGFVNLSKIQNEWFPSVNKYDIFISHSHNDENLAKALAGYLKYKYEISTFIDSLIWGNVFELQQIIDDEYCSEKDEKGNIISYSYEKRNFTTSHLHLMLNTALMQSMQVAKCFFFINTPESINFKNIEGEWTYSPWIYTELSMSKSMFELEKDSSVKTLCECFEGATELPLIQKIQTSHLTSITKTDIDKCCNGKKNSQALESLKAFSAKPPQKNLCDFYGKRRFSNM